MVIRNFSLPDATPLVTVPIKLSRLRLWVYVRELSKDPFNSSGVYACLPGLFDFSPRLSYMPLFLPCSCLSLYDMQYPAK